MAFVAAAEPREASGVPDGNIDQEVAMQGGDIRATADVHLDARLPPSQRVRHQWLEADLGVPA
jgi:hypothetical protein